MNKAKAIFEKYLFDSSLGETFWMIKNKSSVDVNVVDIEEDEIRDSVEVVERETRHYCVCDDIPSSIYVYLDGYTEIAWHTGPDADSLHYSRPTDCGPALIRIDPDGTVENEYWLNGKKLTILVLTQAQADIALRSIMQ